MIGPNHEWELLEGAIQTATVPRLDPLYAETFDCATATVPYVHYEKYRQYAKLGLSPESTYPRCDWCNQNGEVRVYGRWGFHWGCWLRAAREAPATTALGPFTAYQRRTAGR